MVSFFFIRFFPVATLWLQQGMSAHVARCFVMCVDVGEKTRANNGVTLRKCSTMFHHVFDQTVFARDGGLLSYGVDAPDLYRRTATYVDRILRSATPGDLPVQLPTKFEMVVNLKTAKALGLAIPPSIMLRADEVIEELTGARRRTARAASWPIASTRPRRRSGGHGSETSDPLQRPLRGMMAHGQGGIEQNSDGLPMQDQPDLQLAGLSLWVLQFPGAENDYWHENWLNVRVRVEAPGAIVEGAIAESW
jgi:hypothetical protein